MIINPVNPQILLAATSDSIFRTTNGGITWSSVEAGYFMDLEFKPGDPSIVYASTYSTSGWAKIMRSTNGGINWSTRESFFGGATRINLAVSPAWPELVDAVWALPNGGLGSLYFSSNSGNSFTKYFNADCSNNMLSLPYNPSVPASSVCGGQGYYDLAYAINPSNASDKWLGGVNTWITTDGGSNWFLKNFWTSNPNNIPIVHSDRHFLAFHPLLSNTLFECNDGGLYKTTDGGNTWTNLSNGLGNKSTL